MSSAPPPTFENYPGSTSAAGWLEPSPAEPARLVPGRAPSGPPPPGSSGPSRRRLLTVVGGSVAGLALLSFLTSQQPESVVTWPADGTSASAEDPEAPDGSENATDIQGHTVAWTHDWTIDDLGDSQLILVGGGATVIFRVFTVGDDATAVEESQRLLTRHTANFRKSSAVRTVKGGKGSIETGTATVSGTKDGRTMEGEARVAIDRGEDGESLAVIVLQRSGTSEDRREQIARMRRLFLNQIGG